MPPPDWTLDRYRPLLALHVRQLRLGLLHEVRFDASDVLQEVLVRAVRTAEQVPGRTEPELVRWLQAVAGNVLVDLVREHGAARRSPELPGRLKSAAADAVQSLGGRAPVSPKHREAVVLST